MLVRVSSPSTNLTGTLALSQALATLRVWEWLPESLAGRYVLTSRERYSHPATVPMNIYNFPADTNGVSRKDW
jgi:hypothetical protein